jgi:hypothetical protein
MAPADKITYAAEQAKKAAAGQKEHLEDVARKAEALAKEHGEEIQERLDEARHHEHGKGKHPGS